MQEKYFGASNSAQGFKNYFGEIFGRCDFLYIIKGGPGTGKSSFMRRVSNSARERGERIEYYFCSSDPSSLDGIVAHTDHGLIGIVDGTAPHVREPQYPGAYDEIIDLGAFWNKELLIKQKNEIIALGDRKSAEYKNAYTFLRSVGNLRAVNDSLIRDALETEKLTAAANRLIAHHGELAVGKAKIIPSLTDSISMLGRVRLDTFESMAKKLYTVSDCYGAGYFFMRALFDVICHRNVTMRVSYDPICPDKIDGIFIEEQGIAFVLRDAADEHVETDADAESAPTNVNVRRFVNAEKLRHNRSEIRYTAHLAQSSLDGALHALSKAKIYHGLLEEVYGQAMHWREKEKFEAGFKI